MLAITGGTTQAQWNPCSLEKLAWKLGSAASQLCDLRKGPSPLSPSFIICKIGTHCHQPCTVVLRDQWMIDINGKVMGEVGAGGGGKRTSQGREL